MINMQKYALPQGPLCWWCYGAFQLQVGVGLTRMAAKPRLLLPFCSGTLCGWGYGGWFSPSTGRRSGRYVHPVGVAPVPTRSGPQVTNQGYPGLSQFIWWYTWLTPDIKSFPIFRWTVEVWRGVTRPPAAVRQPGAEMNQTDGMSTSAGISQDNSVLNYYLDLSLVLLTYPRLCHILGYPRICHILGDFHDASLDFWSQLTLGYPNGPNLCFLYQDIPGSLLAQGVAFPDVAWLRPVCTWTYDSGTSFRLLEYPAISSSCGIIWYITPPWPI